MRLYSYIGPSAVRERAAGDPPGRAISSREDLEAFVGEHPDALLEAATFVVDAEGTLRLASRRSEHVACAGGGPVRAAGELQFERRGDALVVAEASNQSTGFAPEPASWDAVAVALDQVGIAHPGGYTSAFEFRRCDECRQLNVVKDGWLRCDACDAQLPERWNLRDVYEGAATVDASSRGRASP
jgi:hypothetical protein